MPLPIFRTKTVTDNASETSGLKKCLTAFDLTLLGVGAIIGTGIFVLTGIAAANQAGPAVVLSFIISGFACAFAALAYAELAAAVGGCGSAYGYSYVAFGEIVAWIIGWILLLEYSVSVAAVANGWSGYFNNALSAMGMGLPDMLTKSHELGGIINLPASAIILILMGLLIVGVKLLVELDHALVLGPFHFAKDRIAVHLDQDGSPRAEDNLGRGILQRHGVGRFFRFHDAQVGAQPVKRQGSRPL